MSKVLSSVLSVHDRMWSIRCHRIPDKRRGRDSLHDYWTVDTCSATRREKINTVKKILLPNIDWSQYNLYFCCVDGDKNGSQVVHRTLADFNHMFTLRGSIAFMGKRRTFQSRSPATSKDIMVESNLDFCVLVLDNPDVRKTRCKEGPQAFLASVWPRRLPQLPPR